MKALKILFICNELPPLKRSGFGMFVQSIVNELINLGHQVTVYGQSSKVAIRKSWTTVEALDATRDPMANKKEKYLTNLHN